MRSSVFALAALVGTAGTDVATAQPGDIRSAPPGLDLFFPVPYDNPLTAEKIALGRRLFFDVSLSADRTIACASCHRPERAFSDTVAHSAGVRGRTTGRNAPTILNRAYGASFFWDARARSLEETVLQPIQNADEMGLSIAEVVRRLRENDNYATAFERAFDAPADSVNLGRALASYVRSLRSGGAPIDRLASGDRSALSAEAQAGFRLFTARANCWMCHAGPTLTDEGIHNTGVSWGARDVGRGGVSGRPEDRGLFKTPTLRNVALTAPYMHDGSMRTLEEVITFYERGGGANRNLDPLVRPLRLSPDEKRGLLAFLRALTAD